MMPQPGAPACCGAACAGSFARVSNEQYRLRDPAWPDRRHYRILMGRRLARVAITRRISGALSPAGRTGAFERYRAGRFPIGFAATTPAAPLRSGSGVSVAELAVGAVVLALRRTGAGRASSSLRHWCSSRRRKRCSSADHFGRLRPQEVLSTGDWTHLWYAGGNCFGPLAF